MYNVCQVLSIPSYLYRLDRWWRESCFHLGEGFFREMCSLSEHWRILRFLSISQPSRIILTRSFPLCQQPAGFFNTLSFSLLLSPISSWQQFLTVRELTWNFNSSLKDHVSIFHGSPVNIDGSVIHAGLCCQVFAVIRAHLWYICNTTKENVELCFPTAKSLDHAK